MILGNTLAPEVRSSAAEVDVPAALAASRGRVIAVAFGGPGPRPTSVDLLPEAARTVDVPGRWSLAPSKRDRRRLAAASVDAMMERG